MAESLHHRITFQRISVGWPDALRSQTPDYRLLVKLFRFLWVQFDFRRLTPADT
jgi:hypothetical protein